jgi:hypothetical protein
MYTKFALLIKFYILNTGFCTHKQGGKYGLKKKS